MEENYRKIKAFVSCPKDAKRYKKIVKEVAEDIENKRREEKKFALKIIEYQNYIVPHIGPTAQTVINDKTKDYDIFIGIYCGRFGTPTGNLNPNTNTEYESGSEEEFSIALEKYRQDKIPISLFFKKRTPNLNSKIKLRQFAKLIDFKDSLKQRHQFIVEFNSSDDFRKKVNDFLYESCDNILSRLFSSELPESFKFKEKKNYEHVEEYIKRNVVLYKDAISSESGYLSFISSKELTDVIKKENRIVLLADAGYGKSIELQETAALLSEKESNFGAVLISNIFYEQNKNKINSN